MKISTALAEILCRLKQIIDAHPQRRFHIHQLNNTTFADQYITNAFRQQFGESFYQYQLKATMRYACELLQKGVSVKAVAISLGYQTPRSFARAYKSIYGISPSLRRDCTAKPT